MEHIEHAISYTPPLIIWINNDEIHHDFQINNTESFIVGVDREEVLEKVQRGFESI